MQTPGPTWKRRSTSAAKADIFLRSILFMVCGVLVACPWRVGAATVASHEPYPFQVTGFESGRTWTFVTLDGGDIGRVDTDEIREGDLSSVIDLLQRHSEWTGAEEDLRFAELCVASPCPGA